MQNTEKQKHHTSRHHKTNVNTKEQNKCRVNKEGKLPFFRIQDWKKVKVETEKVNKLIPHIPTINITELNKLLYAGAKLADDEIGVPAEQKCKTWMEYKARRTGKEIATAIEDAKERKKRTIRLVKSPNERVDKSDNTTWWDKSKYIDERRKT